MAPDRPAEGRGWAYGGFIVGGALSVAGNVYHALTGHSEPFRVIVSAAWPIMLALAIEIIARVPWPRGAWWMALRIIGVGTVALVAAIVSYQHMHALLSAWGEGPIVTYLGPLAIDGLMAVSTGALIATRPQPAAQQARVDDAPTRTTDVDVTHHDAPDADTARVDMRTRVTSASPAPPGEAPDGYHYAPTTLVTATMTHPDAPGAQPALVDDAPTATPVAHQVRDDARSRVIAAHAAQPDASHRELARTLGLSDATVRRHRPKVAA